MRNKPNVIYILADDLGYGDLSCFNEQSRIRTANLDRLASQGMRFTDAHASSSLCTPSRYSILTGRYNWRSTLKYGVTWGCSPHLIEDGRMTVASMLRAAGYFTACVGKWHLGMDWARTGPAEADVDFSQPIRNGPLDFGFAYFYGIPASLDIPPYVYIENDRVTAVPDRITSSERRPGKKDWWREGPTGANFHHEQVLSTLTSKVLDLVDAHAAEPFFIYFPLTAPHTPILPSAEFVGKSGTNEYGDFVLVCDDLVGQIMRKLDEKGIAEDTLLVFTSDNGCAPGADFPTLARLGHHPSYVFRGHKADIYEGGHRIPLIVRWPKRIAPGTSSGESVGLVDLMVTLAEIVGVELPEDAGEDSVSNLPVWLGEARIRPLREAIVHHSGDGSLSIRKGRWKLEMCPGSGGWSYPKPGEEPPDSPAFQLYDLDADIGERANVYLQHPEVFAELKALLVKYIVEGRSTPGKPQKNTGPERWPQLHWMGPEGGRAG